jgi:hypothetical protein
LVGASDSSTLVERNSARFKAAPLVSSAVLDKFNLFINSSRTLTDLAFSEATAAPLGLEAISRAGAINFFEKKRV